MHAAAPPGASTPLGVADVWYLDDGQIVCQPQLADPFLKALDQELAQVGATRGEGEGVKSVARAFGPGVAPGGAAEGWATDYVRRTCKVPETSAPIRVLGADLGSAAAAEAQFLERTEDVAEAHEALATLEDPATELVLTRQCLNVCKVMYTLRSDGAALSPEALSRYDEVIGHALDRILGSRLGESSAQQAAAGVSEGGLGFRRAADVALPAVVASRVASRPFVRALLHTCASEGFSFGADLAGRFVAETGEALESLTAQLSPARAQQARQLVAEAEETTQERFERATGNRSGGSGFSTPTTGPVGDGLV